MKKKLILPDPWHVYGWKYAGRPSVVHTNCDTEQEQQKTYLNLNWERAAFWDSEKNAQIWEIILQHVLLIQYVQFHGKLHQLWCNRADEKIIHPSLDGEGCFLSWHWPFVNAMTAFCHGIGSVTQCLCVLGFFQYSSILCHSWIWFSHCLVLCYI